MTPKILQVGGLAACAGALAVAWLWTDSLGGCVILPLLASLTAAGLLIAGDRRAPTVALLAGSLQLAHAVRLLTQGAGPLALAYLACAAILAACGLGLRRYPPPRTVPDPAPDLEDRPL